MEPAICLELERYRDAITGEYRNSISGDGIAVVAFGV
jgi:hypothetical protein